MITLVAAIALLIPQTSRPVATSLSFEIITPQGTGSRVAAQDWGRLFAKIGHIVRLRQQTSADGDGPAEPVTQTETRGARRIKVIGVLDQKGRVHFGKRVFKATDEVRLRKWIDELKKYGVQGDPAGQPMWGLTREQFDPMFRALAKPLAVEVNGKTLLETVTSLELPKTLPIKWTPAAEAVATTAPKNERTLKLYGRGTALAIVLNDAGLGFIPQRQPDGSVALLVIKPGREPLWPIGWPPKISPAKTMREFYARVDVSLPNVTLTRVFEAIEASTQIPIFVDYRAIKAKGLEFEEMRVEIKPRKMSWNNVIRTVSIKNRLNYDLRVDELGKPFIWVSTQEVIRARKDRFRPK